MTRRDLWLVFALLLAFPSAASAETRCEPKVMDSQSFRSGLDLAVRTREALQRSGASVVLLARVGRDMSEYGLRYSHMGIATYDAGAGRWQITHLLNECGTASSSLYQDGLANFFMDDLHAFETLVAVPRAEVQQALLGVLRSRAHMSLHTPAYNTIAYPFSTRYQNCNQWVLELIASNMMEPGMGSGRQPIQHWLEKSAYRPSSIRISAGKRLGAGLFSKNVRFDDHPAESGREGRYQVVSVESVLSFLRNANLMLSEQVLSLQQ